TYRLCTATSPRSRPIQPGSRTEDAVAADGHPGARGLVDEAAAAAPEAGAAVQVAAVHSVIGQYRVGDRAGRLGEVWTSRGELVRSAVRGRGDVAPEGSCRDAISGADQIGELADCAVEPIGLDRGRRERERVDAAEIVLPPKITRS